MIVTSLLAVAMFVSPPTKSDSNNNDKTYFTDVVASRDKTRLDQFVQSLDPAVMKECVDRYDKGKPIDLDYLATCGDFEVYADYLRLSKFEAVKKFEYALLHSSSKLEFEDRLSR
ncbi:hypothetical protein [Stieleria tagensis]|uniref:hypothetical protein n=1 Tax=Stieleria tagensis TaxID=2956795 RepID=UPI00209B54F6|nr:hypothetical protein [Stieleria tagensis]